MTDVAASLAYVQDFTAEDAAVVETDAMQLLARHIDVLIAHDFPALVQLLYRMDVHEQQLKKELAADPQNSSMVIARLIVRRQLQKVAARKQFPQQKDIPDEERW